MELKDVPNELKEHIVQLDPAISTERKKVFSWYQANPNAEICPLEYGDSGTTPYGRTLERVRSILKQALEKVEKKVP